VLASAAHASTVYVANNGTDDASCGSKASPCRSITRGIHVASAGDHVVVGPGSYRGESGAPGCDCFVAVGKPLALTSSDGAASTVIDARGFLVRTNVLITAGRVELGSPGKGFTVTNPDAAGGSGIEIDADDVTIKGDQVIADSSVAGPGVGILASVPNSALIEGNQVLLWTVGILAHGPGDMVRRNQVSLNRTGIDVGGTSVASGNVTSDDGQGFNLSESASAIGNGIYGNSSFGLFAIGSSGGIAGNNVFGNEGGNGNCGIGNNGSPGLNAANNYWGASTGPGPDPADQADQSCVVNGATVTSPFAAAPFHVRAPIKP